MDTEILRNIQYYMILYKEVYTTTRINQQQIKHKTRRTLGIFEKSLFFFIFVSQKIKLKTKMK